MNLAEAFADGRESVRHFYGRTKALHMGAHPRWIREDLVCSSTQRTVDRQFLFKPDPVVRELIGSSAARAQEKFPVRIFWLDYNINHEQLGIAPIDDSLDAATNLVQFKRMFHSILAVALNTYLKREGAVFSSRSRDVHCLDNESVADRFFYALTNPAKDGLCDRIRHWGGFSSYGALAEGRSVTYTFIDRKAWRKNGGPRSKRKLDEFRKSIALEFSPLPGTEHLTESQRQTRIRKQVREMEQLFRDERRAQGRFAMTAESMKKVDHRDRPKTIPEKTRKPLCHGANPAARKMYEDEHRAFRLAHREASVIYLSGHFHVEFPKGSFRPPLIACAA